MSNEPMTIEEIPSDQMVIMNEYWHRAFNAAGCDPACHSCHRSISIGIGFHLATVERYWTKDHQVRNEDGTTEVMLCAMCTADGFIKKIVDAKESIRRTSGNAVCFRINGKIIH